MIERERRNEGVECIIADPAMRKRTAPIETNVGWLAPLENRAAMKELNNNNVEGNNPAAECCDVILEKRIS